MNLRPVPARWFELLTVPDDLARALEALARTGAIELETRSEPAAHAQLPSLQEPLAQYHVLARRYQAYWPQSDLRPSGKPGSPAPQFDAALRQLMAWSAAAESLVHRIEVLQAEQTDLRLLAEMLAACPREIDLALLVNAGPALHSRLLVLPSRTRPDRLPVDVTHLQIDGPAHAFLLAVAPGAALQLLERELTALKGRGIPLPPWLEGTPDAAGAQVAQRAQDVEAALQRRRAEVAALTAQHGLHQALGDIRRLEWLLAHVARLPASDNFVWVTGWTSDPDGASLQAALTRARVRSVLAFPASPLEHAPLVLRNPRWVRPFELFVRLLGMPSRTEADPSALLACTVPLLFGYMFGDVGQGLVLLIAGLYLQRRWPALRVMVSGGAAAVLFGFLFGSVFSSEGLLEPLWLRPMQQPLPVLIVPLLAGMLILLVGVLLNAVEAGWRGEWRTWWLTEVPLPLLYLGALGLLVDRRAQSLIVLGLVWQVIGSAWHERRRPLTAALAGLGALAEHFAQLLINTLSFARVGAFALAHAGLSLAFVSLAHAAGGGFAAFVILLFGNLLVLALEGLVVSIQTTRLVLFEFFVRFLRAEGRVFQPLTAP